MEPPSIEDAITQNIEDPDAPSADTSGLTLSPVLARLPPERLPDPSTVCTHCPRALWFASPKSLTCFCRVMFTQTWSTKEPQQILLCDGPLMTNDQ